MKRRAFLRVGGSTAILSSVSVAGCLERLGFEEQSAWRDPPLVEDRPDAVYIPAAREEMAHYGSDSDGQYAVALSYSYPHRFWNVRDGSVSAVEVQTDDALHLMFDVWDVETQTTLPVDMSVDVERDGDRIESFTPWPMLSQRMGFHYGDNVTLDGEGEYVARVRVGPVTARKAGGFEGRFDEASTLTIPFTYRRSDVHDLSFETIDYEERGRRGALPLMDHGDHGGHGHGDEGHGHDDHNDGNGHGHDDETTDPGVPPLSRAPSVESLPGTHLGTERTGDADLVIVEYENDHRTDSAETYLAVSPRTPYNEVILPLLGLSVKVSSAADDGGSEATDDENDLGGEPASTGGRTVQLRETLDADFGHHYGATIEQLNAGDEVTVTVESPPQVTRHDGYETAFLAFEDVTVVR